MVEVLNATLISPNVKIDRVKKLVNLLYDTNVMKDWTLEIENQPI